MYPPTTLPVRLLSPLMPWHQRVARTVTFGALSAVPVLGPFSAAGYLFHAWGI